MTGACGEADDRNLASISMKLASHTIIVTMLTSVGGAVLVLVAASSSLR